MQLQQSYYAGREIRAWSGGKKFSIVFEEGEALGVRQLAAALNSKIFEIVIREGGSKLPHSKALFERI